VSVIDFSTDSRCGPEQHALRALPAGRGISRFPYKKLPHMPGSVTTPGRPGAREWRVWASTFGTVSAPGDDRSFAVQWLAYALPCRRFAGALAGACARLGADVDRYSFTVRDFHPLLLAGHPAHSETLLWGLGSQAENSQHAIFSFNTISLFDLNPHFFAPTHSVQTLSRAGFVKVGRRSDISS